MNCKQARHEIALWVGHDLDGLAVQELQRHCAECTSCSDQWRRIKANIEVLQHSGSVLESPGHKSLWPSVAAKLPDTRPSCKRPLHDWVAVGTVVAACLLVGLFVDGPVIGQQGYYLGPGFNLDSLPPSYEVYYSDPSWKRVETPPAQDAADASRVPLVNVDF